MAVGAPMPIDARAPLMRSRRRAIEIGDTGDELASRRLRQALHGGGRRCRCDGGSHYRRYNCRNGEAHELVSERTKPIMATIPCADMNADSRSLRPRSNGNPAIFGATTATYL
jgi:hypothetical protein